MKITVIGAGNCGLAMAAYISRAGHEVTLWNRTGSKVAELMARPLIRCEGIIQEEIPLHCVTDDMVLALEAPDLILITTPANAHKDLAESMARHLQREVPIILNPGRTLGALEFRMTFQRFNESLRPPIAEAQTIIFTCRRTGVDRVHVIAMKSDVLLSTFDARQNKAMVANLPGCIRPFFLPAASMIETSIGNVGMILHCAPLLLNAGWTENETSLYKYYYDGITPTIASFLEKLDLERVAVSKALGHTVERTEDWLKRSYPVEGETLYECLQNNEAYRKIDAPATLQHRYLFEDVPCGLVPLEAVGLNYGIDMTHTSLIIDLASRLMKVDFRRTGRSLESLGLSCGKHCLREILEGETGT